MKKGTEEMNEIGTILKRIMDVDIKLSYLVYYKYKRTRPTVYKKEVNKINKVVNKRLNKHSVVLWIKEKHVSPGSRKLHLSSCEVRVLFVYCPR